MVVTTTHGSATATLHCEEVRYDLVILGKGHVGLMTSLEDLSCIVLCRSYTEFGRQKGVHYLPLPLRYTKLYLYITLLFDDRLDTTA
jgi:hypothetical protein